MSRACLRALLGVVLCAVLACQGHRATRTKEEDMEPPLLEERLGYPTGADADSAERAARQEDSERIYEQAVAAYEAGNYASAARDFLRASEPLLQEVGAPAWEVMAHNRRVCYANAWSAWRLAGDVEQGRAALRAARDRDPVNASHLQSLLDAPVE